MTITDLTMMMGLFYITRALLSPNSADIGQHISPDLPDTPGEIITSAGRCFRFLAASA